MANARAFAKGQRRAVVQVSIRAPDHAALAAAWLLAGGVATTGVEEAARGIVAALAAVGQAGLCPLDTTGVLVTVTYLCCHDYAE